MQTSSEVQLKSLFTSTKQSNSSYWIAAVAILGTFILTIISWFRICSEACSESHSYRLFGFTFEQIGLVVFPLLLISHLYSRQNFLLSLLTSLMLCGAIGAELMFIFLQKYVIGRWCPICLSIAALLAIAGIIYFKDFLTNLKQRNKGHMMNTLFKGATGSIALVVGFVLAFAGITKYDELQADENNVKEIIAFGNINSPIEVYVFTDWECPACRSLEKTFEAMSPTVMQKAKLTFVDDPVHDATLNYTPYNLAFMAYNKPQYFALRNGLSKLSIETKSPTEQQVASMAASLGVSFRPIEYSNIAMATRYFDSLINQYNVEGTPTVVIANKLNNKSKKLEGTSEINTENILKAISTLGK